MFRSLFLFCASIALGQGASSTMVLIPAGSMLETRLYTPVGSHASHPGDRVTAVLIAPVTSTEHDLLLLPGATISGTVISAKALGFGLKRGGAELDICFDTLRLEDGTAYPIQARVAEVETARERVGVDGTIQGINPAASLSTGISFLMSTVLIHSELEAPALAVKLLAARSPDSEINLPRGSELLVELKSGLSLETTGLLSASTPPITPRETTEVRSLLAELPARAELSPHHASDPVNILLIGSKEQVEEAFRAAGWTGESRHSALALYRMYHCLTQRMGYSMAPMSKLFFNGFAPTKSYQKSLDTLSKRHHVRFWRQGNTNVWLGAATEDVNLTFRRMHFTHAIDEHIDNERAKLVNDLWFAGCVSESSLLTRESFRTASVTDLSMPTDGSVAVLRLGDCNGRASFPVRPAETVRTRFDQVLLALKGELMRANPLSVGFAGTRSVLAIVRRQPAASPVSDHRLARRSVVDTPAVDLASSHTVAMQTLQ
jgi:LssY C-terminus